MKKLDSLKVVPVYLSPGSGDCYLFKQNSYILRVLRAGGGGAGGGEGKERDRSACQCFTRRGSVAALGARIEDTRVRVDVTECGPDFGGGLRAGQRRARFLCSRLAR